MILLSPKRDLNLVPSRIAVFKDCKAAAQTTRPPRLDPSHFFTFLFPCILFIHMFYLSLSLSLSLFSLSLSLSLPSSFFPAFHSSFIFPPLSFLSFFNFPPFLFSFSIFFPFYMKVFFQGFLFEFCFI